MKTRLIAMTLAVATGWTWACGSDSSPTMSADHGTDNSGDSHTERPERSPLCSNREGECSTVVTSSPLSKGNRVATSTWCELGSVDPDKGIAIRLGNVLDIADHPADITFQWLADRLHVSSVEVWAALDLPNNEGFVSALYAAKASEWSYEINEPGTPFVSPFGDDYTPPLKIAMPHEPPPHAEALRWLDEGQNSQPDWFYSWPLPRAELWLPKDIAATTYTPAIGAADCRELDALPLGPAIVTSDS